MKLNLFSTLNREVRGMHQAAYLLAIFAFGSQCLALVRDRLLAANFGTGHVLDLYYAAFRIPDFLFATVASLLSLYALLPILSKIDENKPGQAVSFLRSSLFIFFLVMGLIAGILYLLAPILVPIFTPGVAEGPLINLVRILLLQPILLGASNTVAAFTQLRHRFVLYSISPLLYNLGIIFGITTLYPLMGITGLGWGVIGGALLHFLVQIPYFTAERSKDPMKWRSVVINLKQVLKLSIPRTLALAAGQITLLVLIGIASFFAVGSISVFMLAFNLQAVPLTIIGVSYSVAAFPTLARMHARGEREAFVAHIEGALRHISLWSILATIYIIVLRAQLVRVVLGSGFFDWTATRLTAAALALFVCSLLAQSCMLLIARVYYAAGNTVRPLFYGLCNVMVSVCSSLLLVFLFRQYPIVREFLEALFRVDEVPGTLVLTLALGYSLGSIVQFIIGFSFFVRDFNIPTMKLKRLTFEIFSSSVIGWFISYRVLSLVGSVTDVNTTLGVATQGFAAAVIGIGFTVFILLLLGNQELKETITSFKRRFSPHEVAIELTDIAS